MTALPDYIQFNNFPGTPLNQIFSAASDDALEVLDKMLTLNPSKRCTSTQVSTLHHPKMYVKLLLKTFLMKRFQS